MKYLKTFEKQLKHTSEEVLNDPLYELVKKLEEIIKEIIKIDSIPKTKVIIYFRDDGNITISYKHDNYALLDIEIYKTDSNIKMYIYSHQLMNNERLKCNSLLELNDYLKNKLNKYIINGYSTVCEYYLFNLIDINDIMNNLNINDIVEKLKFKKLTNKYNI